MNSDEIGLGSDPRSKRSQQEQQQQQPDPPEDHAAKAAGKKQTLGKIECMKSQRGPGICLSMSYSY